VDYEPPELRQPELHALPNRRKIVSEKKNVAGRKVTGLRKALLEKAVELTAQALKYAKMGDEIWALTYLRSATSVIEAVRNL
jgi:hypothetical protein